MLLYSLFKKYLTDSVIFAPMPFHHSLRGFISRYDELLAFWRGETTALRVPVVKGFAEIHPDMFSWEDPQMQPQFSCVCWHLRLPCRSSEERICEVPANSLVTLIQVKTRGVWTCAE